MARYSKRYSNYILRKVHTTVNGGTIFERDWGTLGERHVIEPGKKKVYSDGNFLFTENNLGGLKKRNYTGEWSEPYDLDNLDPNVNKEVNDTSRLGNSNDLRDYAYYGSASEMVRAAIENIVKWFPGRAYADSTLITKLDSDGVFVNLYSITDTGGHNYRLTWSTENEGLSVVRNPFEMDFHHQEPVLKETDNRMRNIPISWTQYTDGGAALTSWNVWITDFNECEKNYDVTHEITFTVEGSANITHIWGLKYNRETIWCTDNSELNLHPNSTVVESYFSQLDGFESKLLDRTTNPQYTSKILTPIKKDEVSPTYDYVERKYTWPSTGYCIDVGTVSYFNFVNSIGGVASLLDGMWSDNLWENMTHESIKNFDWTYTMEYEIGQEEENILGGHRMEEMLRVMGRFYDDIKRYIDGITLKNVVTYDGICNTSSAEVSDRAEMNGWEVFSTKQYDDSNLIIGNFADTLPKIGPRFSSTSTIDHKSWYNTVNPEYVSQNIVDNDFMRRLTLSSSTIFKSKGTKHSIEMVMALFGIGEDDFSIEERYYSVEPKRRDDIFWFYERNDDPDDYVEYEELEDIDSLDDMLAFKNNILDGSCPYHVILGGNYYDLRGDMTVGEFCEFLNSEKNVRKNYPDDEFSGIPIKDVYLKNSHYIVPYFSQRKIYDGNVQFETLGGWGKMVEELGFSVADVSKEEFDYMETVPYMEVVQTCGELLTVNMYDVKGKRIYYVMDLSDLGEYTDVIPNTVSHFFKLDDPYYPNLFSSWRNVPVGIDVTDPQSFNEYCSELDENNHPVRGLMFGVNYDDWRLARYLDSIRADSIGNNPHVGFGLYDLGRQYRDYLERPFKYVADYYGFADFRYCEIADQFRYTVTEHCGEKIKNLVYGDEGNDEVVNFNCADEEEDCVTFGCEERYYEPRKILIIKNNLDSEEYRRYFMDVIVKYLLQVIASTTILVLVGFKPNGDCVRFACEAV